MMQRTSNPILHRLQQTLETNAPREEVAEALEAAEVLGDDLPPLLAYRARERMDADRFLGRRRIGFAVACSVFLFLSAISSVGLTTVLNLRAGNRDETAFMQLLGSEQWDEAQAFLDSLDETTRSRQTFSRGQQLIQQERENERQREAEFAELVEEIHSDPSGAVDEETAIRLDELARSDEERAIAAEAAAKADEQRLERDAGRVDDQTQLFDKLQQDVEHFFESEADTLSDVARASRMRELQKQLQQFVSANHLSNPDLTETAKQTAELLVREDQRAQMRSDKQQLVDAITSSVGDADRFLGNIDRFVTSFPDDPLAGELKQRVEDRKVIVSAEAWIDVLKHDAYTKPQMADSKQTAQWLEKLDLAMSLDAQHPLSQSTLPWQEHYSAIAKRSEAMKQLRELFQSELLGRMYMYPDLKQGWYYSDMSPQRDSPTAHVVEYFADLSMNRKTKNFGSSYRDQIVPRVQMAGHSTYAAKGAQVISSMRQSDFTPTVYRLINELRALDDSDIDPIFQLDLLRRLLQIGVDGSVPLAAGFGDWKKSLEASDFAWDANWLSPGDSDPLVTDARDAARSLLEIAGDWDGRVKRMSESFRRFREPRQPSPVWIGWVAREEDRYVALLKSQPSRGPLFVLAYDQKSARTSLVEIAPATGPSSPSIEEKAAQVVGSPIYQFPPTPGPSSSSPSSSKTS
jgi:hypothetical protein